MPRLRFTTLVAAPLTVAFDVARALDHPWPVPLREVESVRPERDVYAAAPGGRWRRLTHTRRYTATADGTVVEEQVDWATALPGVLGRVADRLLCRRVRRAMRAHLDGYAAAAARRAVDVVQVVGAALVDGDRVLVARRSGGPFDGCWEFPGGKVEPGEPELDALVREIGEELGVAVVPGAFLGEVVLDGAVAGGPPGTSTLRVWQARVADGGRLTALEHSELRWVTAGELESLDWIPADRPLLPAVRALLAGR
ncbi:NUDIX domain-containing protein [Geodermatophilus sp. DSM 44513]|uniref:NUDIX domain-containing protein n=1 Tax=Geodermatophilus sp. DSM 44513 TaxID=1528104 RepID=UPI001286C394|nr:NUDIX domain-containing protein [Geodermatophilus sp. DSM 44513]WNV76564.1 NUDIX domain-containing protein [Geodermatophilus sp. DSM 44513]